MSTGYVALNLLKRLDTMEYMPRLGRQCRGIGFRSAEWVYDGVVRQPDRRWCMQVAVIKK